MEKVAAKDKLIVKLQSDLSSAQNTVSKLEVQLQVVTRKM